MCILYYNQVHNIIQYVFQLTEICNKAYNIMQLFIISKLNKSHAFKQDKYTIMQ